MPLDLEPVLTPACRATDGSYPAGCGRTDDRQYGDLQGKGATGLFPHVVRR